MRCNVFNLEYDGAFDFSINQVFFVNNPKTKNLEIATSGNTESMDSTLFTVYELSALLMSLFIPVIPIMEAIFIK